MSMTEKELQLLVERAPGLRLDADGNVRESDASAVAVTRLMKAAPDLADALEEVWASLGCRNNSLGDKIYAALEKAGRLPGGAK
jgi:hypothetical protein